MLSLRELQLRFAAALDPGVPGAPPDPALGALIVSRGALGAVDRLGIYADMYRARLVDVLREDFPRLAAILGDDAFAALAGRYLARHPSTHPSVRHVGRHFVRFTAGEPAVEPRLADLARLEWARVEVFDAPDAEPLRLDDLAGVPPADWPEIRFRTIPACRIIESRWPLHRLWAAAEEPALAADPRLAREPEPTTIRVWREGWSVSHAAMGEGETRALGALRRGEPFGALCSIVGDDRASADAAREMGGLLMRWLEDGLLARRPV